VSLEAALRLLGHVKRHIERERARIESLGTLSVALAEGLKTQNDARERRAAGAAEEANAVHLKREAIANRILSRLPGHLSKEAREELLALSRQYVTSSSEGAAIGLEVELRRRIQEARESELAREREIASAQDLQSSLRDFTDPGSLAIAAELDSVSTGLRRLDADLRSRAELAVDQAKRGEDRRYAKDVLAQEFAALGYEITSGFDTAFMQGGAVIISRPNADAYGIEMSCDPNKQTLATRVVRLRGLGGAPSEHAILDSEAEEAWCSDYARVFASASRKGLQARLTRQEPVGAQPVPLASANLLTAHARSSRVRSDEVSALRPPPSS